MLFFFLNTKKSCQLNYMHVFFLVCSNKYIQLINVALFINTYIDSIYNILCMNIKRMTRKLRKPNHVFVNLLLCTKKDSLVVCNKLLLIIQI